LEIKNVTSVDEMMYVKLQHFAMRIFKKHNFLNYLFFGVISFFAFLSSVISIVLSYVSESDVSFPYYQLFFFVTFTGFYFIYYFIIPKQMYKASSLYNGTESYVFTENEIINETASKKISSRSVFKYENICKVYEKTGILYIYVSNNMVLLVSKYGFETDEELDAVRAKLKAAVPAKKYTVIK
jgi:hypothetical protein